jgi:hypothetical protein
MKGSAAGIHTLEPDRPQHDRLATCVIAQQYSSTSLVSMHLSSQKEKSGSRFKKNYFILFSFS